MSATTKKTVKKEREYLNAVSIYSGIITMIEQDGTIGQYRQRGIGKLPRAVLMELVSAGKLDPYWWSCKELPSNYSISFEDEEIMGKARATFPYKG